MKPSISPWTRWRLGALALGGASLVVPARWPAQAPGRSPDGSGGGTGTLVVLNKAAASASLIDLARGKVYATLPTGEGPHELAVSADGRWAVATNYGSGEAAGSTLTVLDLRERRVARTIDLAPYHRPHGIAWLPDGRRVVVTAEAESALVVVDVPSGTIDGAVRTGQGGSHMVAVTPDGRHAYVANIASGTVTQLDLRRMAAVRTTPTGAGTEGIDVSPDGREVWVTNREANSVTVLDASSLRAVATVASADFPIRVKLTPDGRRALVSNARSGDVRVFNTPSRKAVGTIEMRVGSAGARGTMLGEAFDGSTVPIGIVVSADSKRAYVANAGVDVIAVVDIGRLEVVGRLEAGREPDGLGFSPLPAEDGR